MKVLLCALVLLGCDESPFGTRHVAPEDVVLGKLAPEVEGSSPCLAWASPSKMLTGLGNGHHFLIANKANSTLLAFDQLTPGQPWVQTGSAKPIGEVPFDVTATIDNCPYVSTNQHTIAVPFDSGDCQSDAPSYPVGPALIAFDSAGTLYAVRPDSRAIFVMPTSGSESGGDVPVTPERITIHESELWVAYKQDPNSWDILAFDKAKLTLKGHVSFPWDPSEDLAGMVWNDISGNLVAHGNDRDPLICAYIFIPQP